MESWPRAIMHLDGDAFFASCEQAVHPELKGKPVITGMERNIVASMSYEAKATGIKRALPLWEAVKICPSVICLPSDYETYSLISKRMFSIMRRYTPTVEEYSIDEAFAELSGLRRLYRTGYPNIAERIRKHVERELDIPASAGLSLTKTLAKLASKYKKPHGFTAIPGYSIHLFLKNISVDKVTGIGPNTTALLNKKGVFTALDYVSKTKVWAKSTLGKIGVELWHELRGEMVYAINPKEKSTYASISKTKTFTPPSGDYAYVKAQLFRNAESGFIKLRRYHLRTARLIIQLREQDFKTYGIESDLSRPITSAIEIFDILERMLRSIYQASVQYRQTGIVLAQLEEDKGLQFELFESPARMIRMHRLAESIDKINTRHGKHTVHSGMGLYLGRDSRKNEMQREIRNTLPQRKNELLRGETFRQRLGIPVVKIKV